MPFGEYLQKHIFDVCGMKRTGFTLNEKIKEQMCSQYVYDGQTKTASLKGKWNQFILTPAYQSGGAGLISCVEDYIKFVIAMSNSNKLLKGESIDMMCANQLGEFGWDGAAGSYVMIDPDKHIGVFYATHVCGHGEYLYKILHQQIRDEVYRVILGV